MALIRIGLQEPDDIKSDLKHAFHEDGMHYELFIGEHDQLYVAADHEDVGLITWYWAEREDWEDLRDAAEETIG